MNIFKLLDKGLYGFLMFFFILYIGKFGVSDLILEPINKWNIIFNIGAWFVLTMFCAKGLFANHTKETSSKFHNRKLKISDKGETK